VNVNRRWLGASKRRTCVLAAGLALLGGGWLLIGNAAHERLPFAHVSALASQTDASRPAFQPSSHRAWTPASVTESAQLHGRSLMSGLPLMFEPNDGQANLNASDPNVKFIARGSGYVLALGSEGATLSLRSHNRSTSSKAVHFETIRMKLAGANPQSRIHAIDPLPARTNYLLGNDPAKWRRAVPQFGRVRYEDIYPGISLVFYGNRGRLEHDFQVAPGADPSRAELEFDGARKLELQNGVLIIKQTGGELRLEAPRVYQQIDGREETVAAQFVLRGSNRAGFSVGAYDHSRELVIDPVLNFSSFFGGSGDELATSVAVDGAGFIYLTGSTDSPNLPLVAGTTPFQSSLSTTPPATNVYVAKLNPAASQANANPLVYVTYLGGNGTDAPAPFGGIAVDGAGDAYVAGTTTSTNFPTTSTAYQTSITSGQHVFVTELNATASGLNYSSYLAGNGTDVASGMTIDAAADIYVTGTTTSNNTASLGTQFPATGLPSVQAFQPNSKAAAGLPQFFVTKVSTTSVGTGSIFYSTYFGGGSFAGSGVVPCGVSSSTPTGLVACGGGIAVDTNLNIYFTGTTNFVFTGTTGSTDFPILAAYQPCLDVPAQLVTIINPTCTPSSVPNPGAPDAFIAKFVNPNGVGVLQGQQLQWSTYLGGSANDYAGGIALDPGAANVYLVGTTNSTDFTLPTATGQFQSKPGGGTDAFVARFPNLTPTSTTTLTLGYFSYLGGSGNETGLAMVADNTNGGLVTGTTESTNFPFYPTKGTIQSTLTGSQDAFVARLNTVVPPGANNQTGSWASYFGGATSDNGNPATTEGTGITLDTNQNAYFAGSTNTTDLQETVPAGAPGSSNAGGNDAFVTQLRATPGVTISGVATLGTNQAFFPAGNPATFTYTVTNVGQDPAYNLVVIDNLSATTTSTNVALTFDSASSTAGSCNTATTNGSVSCTIGSLQPGSIATVTFVVTPTANTSGTPASFNGGQVSIVGQNNILLAVTSVAAQMSDFGVSVFPSNNSVPAAGQTATYDVQLKPNPVYGTNVSLSCTNVPTAASCNFTPSNSISLQGSSPATATLNLTTTPQSITTASSQSGLRHFYAVFLGVPGLALVGVGIAGDRRRRLRLAGLFLLLVVIAQLLPLPGCASQQTQPPPTGTPPGTYSITVTATSGSDSKSVPIQLTVP
jgi:uncharacterized repeat protein (TIGR01451 family)